MIEEEEKSKEDEERQLNGGSHVEELKINGGFSVHQSSDMSEMFESEMKMSKSNMISIQEEEKEEENLGPKNMFESQQKFKIY